MPTDPILGEFGSDLALVRRLLDLLDSLRAFSGIGAPAEGNSDGFGGEALAIHEKARGCLADTVVLIGTTVLYLGGRFEFFVRTLFEDLCDRVASRCERYDQLPKEMRESLVAMTAQVIASPKKYGHGDQGVRAFVRTLATNLGDDQTLQGVNSKCLSVTTENMWADTLQDLFERIGAKDVWQRIGQQAKVLTLFETDDAENARGKARRLLNQFMETRNKIAHPVTTIDWPDSAKVREYVDFFDTLSAAICDVADVYEVSLSARVAIGAAQAGGSQG